MNEQTTNEAVEWYRLLDLAIEEARTETGKELLEALDAQDHWAKTIEAARHQQQETGEISRLLDRDALWGPLSGLTSPESAIERLVRSAILELEDLRVLRGWIYAADSWSQTPRDELPGELFRKALTTLPDFHEAIRFLDRILTPEGELSERASPKLASLYAEIRSTKKEIGVVLDQLLRSFSQKGVLQENFSDVRDGRYVIPVKISCQNEIDGIIYEASVSRQTVFIEPKEVGALNNRLRQRQNDLIQEIHNILSDASKQLKPFAPELSMAVATLSHWDAVQAKARLGRSFSGKTITLTEDRFFSLRQTAHPLLWWSLAPEQIIRNDLEFGGSASTLLLTGPNTGGKTVLLKTLGLAGICARTGFPFPAIETPIIPFFDSFFADLGDPQSIEQHLSSFAGHILRFRDILTNISEQSLVLVDELNTATDPEEGAALGRAFLETVMSRGAMVVVTTHDPHLKALSLTDSRILNASMAFDESSRSPTYRMILGVPGRSRALETAERLGIPMEVITLARKYISTEHQEFENLLSKLENDTRDAAIARKEAQRLKDEAEHLKAEWTARTQHETQTLLDKTRQRLRRILEQAQDEVRTSVRKLDEAKNRKDVDKTRSELNELVSSAQDSVNQALKEEAPELAAVIEKKPEATTPQTPTLAPGVRVRIPKWKSTGTIISIQRDKAKVAMGAIQMTLGLHEMDALPPEIKPTTQTTYKMRDMNKPPAPPREIDLRGQRFEDAMGALERYLDQAYRSEAFQEITIIHGLGTGALREGTRKLLSELPYIKTYRDGGVGHGGTGSTIVEFERN